MMLKGCLYMSIPTIEFFWSKIGLSPLFWQNLTFREIKGLNDHFSFLNTKRYILA